MGSNIERGTSSADQGSASIIIIHKDENLTVVHKPAGMLVHRSRDTSNREFSLCMHLRQLLQHDVYPVHRLDRATSGIIVFANSSADARLMAHQLKDRSIEKVYLAVVRGWTTDRQTIDYPLAKDKPKVSNEEIPPKDDAREKQNAVTHLRTLGKIELPYAIEGYATARYSLVELSPVTGRRHQLRRHMKHINHPIIGDTVYGRGAHNRFFRQNFSCERLLLHAQKITLEHPQGGIRTFIAPPDEKLMHLIQLFSPSLYP